MNSLSEYVQNPKVWYGSGEESYKNLIAAWVLINHPHLILTHPFFADANIEQVKYMDDLDRTQKLFIDNKLNINSIMLASVNKKINEDFDKYLEGKYGLEAIPAVKEDIMQKAKAGSDSNCK